MTVASVALWGNATFTAAGVLFSSLTPRLASSGGFKHPKAGCYDGDSAFFSINTLWVVASLLNSQSSEEIDVDNFCIVIQSAFIEWIFGGPCHVILKVLPLVFCKEKKHLISLIQFSSLDKPK